MTLSAEQQYLAHSRRIVNEGVIISNERTGIDCHTVINADMRYDARNNAVPLLTTKQVFFRKSIAEIVGYLRGFTSAAQFRDLGCDTWDKNANETPAWLANPNRKGTDDIGRCYGPQARNWRAPNGKEIDQLAMIIDCLKRGYDDRGLTMTFWNPGEMDLACLRPCMRTHTFSLLGKNLFLTSEQRSSDWPLGVPFNMVQTIFLLRVVAQITGNQAHTVFHNIINAHIYSNQLPNMVNIQLKREPLPPTATLHLTQDLRTLEDLETWFNPQNPEHVWVENYQHHGAISYPFAV